MLEKLVAVMVAGVAAVAVAGCSADPPSPAATASTTSAAAHHSFAMPDLRGMYWTDAEPQLRALGWVGVLSKGTDIANSPYPLHSIAAQQPTPGQPVQTDGLIEVQFAV